MISFENDAATPSVLGELDISGFSNYIQSINQDDTLILALGMDAEDNGTPLGLQLTLFNTTNQTNPEIVHRYVMGTNSSELWSGSEAQFDFKAFRYLPIDEEEGRIIIPIYYSDFNGTSFDGFSVFSLSPDGIAPLFEISHYGPHNLYESNAGVENTESEDGCFMCDYLRDRSFVVDGNVITLKSQSARSHNLDSGEFLWGLNFTGPEYCCPVVSAP